MRLADLDCVLVFFYIVFSELTAKVCSIHSPHEQHGKFFSISGKHFLSWYQKMYKNRRSILSSLCSQKLIFDFGDCVMLTLKLFVYMVMIFFVFLFIPQNKKEEEERIRDVGHIIDIRFQGYSCINYFDLQ